MPADTIGLILTAVLRLFAQLPLPVSQLFGRMIGRTNYLIRTRAAKVTLENLALCFPEMGEEERRSLAARSLVQTGQTMMETPAVWLSSLDRASTWIDAVENEQLLDDALALGKGVIVLLPHLGNWEMFNVYFSTRGKMTALYQPPRQDVLKPLMSSIRQKFGNEVVATNIKGLASLYRRLEKGGVVTILPDQVPARGEYAPFFGQSALTDVLVSRLIRKTGAVAVCCIVRRQRHRFVVSFSEAAHELYSDQVSESVLGLNHSIEQCISSHLEQYQWEYKRFRKRPTGMQRLYNYRNHPTSFH